MTTAQVVETSVTVNNSPIQDYVHLDDQTQPTFINVTANDILDRFSIQAGIFVLSEHTVKE